MKACALVALLLCISTAAYAGNARSYAIVNTSPPRRTRQAPEGRSAMDINGFTPAELKKAYGYSTSMSAGSGTTIAIIGCYDAPNIEAELATYSTQFGLPSCTTANGCFKKVGQTGGSSIAADPDGDWLTEVSLDVQMVHAIAPGAKILLVLATSSSSSDVLAAIKYAGNNAKYVSMSLGFDESSSNPRYEATYFSAPGVSYFVASGDNGPGVDYPGTSPNCIAVGGTTLYLDDSGNTRSEIGWTGSGGGVSTYSNANSVQAGDSRVTAVAPTTTKRKVPDISSVADPTTGVAVYSQGQWIVVGGTSAACPIIAARASHTGVTVNAASVYNGMMSLRDITQGYSTTSDNSATYQCLVNYDYVTGLGSWIGSTFNTSATTAAPGSTTTPAPGSTTTAAPGSTTTSTPGSTTTRTPGSTTTQAPGSSTTSAPTPTPSPTQVQGVTLPPWLQKLLNSSGQSNQSNMFLVVACVVVSILCTL